MPPGSLWVLLGVAGILTVVGLYPAWLMLRPHRAGGAPETFPDPLPSVAVICAARNAGALIEAKLENFLHLDYPADRLILVIASDASTDATREIVRKAGNPRLRLVEQTPRGGKAAALNLAVSTVDADLLLFSDADARLAPDAVRKLVRHFADPAIGGVCGRRRVQGVDTRRYDAQQTYVDWDSRLKTIESAHGRITANDGKIHMIRRALFRRIPADVTDDLYTALAVVAQGYRFVFEPAAVADVPRPSRDVRHEIHRRRRIVTRSLTGILRMRETLNPLRFGLFAVGLLVNKVGRRLLPFFLLAIIIGAARLAAGCGSPAAAVVMLWSLALGVAFVLRAEAPSQPVWLSKRFEVLQYILAGFIGTAWGVFDMLAGKRVRFWEPFKG